MKKVFLSLAIVAAVVSAAASYRYFREQRLVDQCLSSKHGSFDYSRMSCDLSENHVYVPYDVRHPYDEPIGLASTLCLVAAISAYAYIERRGVRKSG